MTRCGILSLSFMRNIKAVIGCERVAFGSHGVAADAGRGSPSATEGVLMASDQVCRAVDLRGMSIVIGSKLSCIS